MKRAIEQHQTFRLEGPPKHLLVDEYQDLNRCDLALIRTICDRGAEVFVAGDDDQSIYGFRKAHPEGIRRFVSEYGAEALVLTICKRCASRIVNLATFVAEQDYERDEKELVTPSENGEGQVEILRFDHQNEEANGIARLCAHLVEKEGVAPEEILVLVRSDRYGHYSSVVRTALGRAGVLVAQPETEVAPLLSDEGRAVVSVLRLSLNLLDHLAWRTLLHVRPGVGTKTVRKLYETAKSQSYTFADVVLAVTDDPSTVPLGEKVKDVVEWARSIIDSLEAGDREQSELDAKREELREEGVEFKPSLQELVETVVREVASGDQRAEILHELDKIRESAEANSIGDLTRAIGISDPSFEQDREKGKVNILTMHKAKGLTADATIVMAAEDELLPGRAEGEHEGDERRLLYVSLSRARSFLFVTYCERRVGVQRQTGREPGTSSRTLTRFLRGAPLAPKDGRNFVAELGEIPLEGRRGPLSPRMALV